MRVLSALDWPIFVEAVSRVERILRRDPAACLRRHGSADAEIAIANQSSSCRGARGSTSWQSPSVRSSSPKPPGSERPSMDRAHHVGYYLISRGRFELEKAVGYGRPRRERISRWRSGIPPSAISAALPSPRRCSRPAFSCTRATTARRRGCCCSSRSSRSSRSASWR